MDKLFNWVYGFGSFIGAILLTFIVLVFIAVILFIVYMTIILGWVLAAGLIVGLISIWIYDLIRGK
jgi:hypothetical protein